MPLASLNLAPKKPAILTTPDALRQYLHPWRQAGQSIGLVPTMGALHIGHASLIAEARRNCDQVVATIFVNPTQFNRPEDLAKYPRTLDADLNLCQDYGADAVFCPDAGAMYPAGHQTKISLSQISRLWEGEHRPGHFDGVATVVNKLFNLAQPSHAYFGEKDYQQLQLIKTMVRDLDLPIAIIGCPTVRENSGLAFASRNALLAAENRPIAPRLYEVQIGMAKAIREGQSALTAANTARLQLQRSGFGRIDYIAAVDGMTLEPLEHYAPNGRILTAAWLGEVRLIDNISLDA
jgi:pantoate--beta-alanine ligase